jgi:hypothetical protein
MYNYCLNPALVNKLSAGMSAIRILFLVTSIQILSRVKPAVGGDSAVSVSEKKKKNKAKKSPRLEEYLNQRDYLGAQTLLEVAR